MLCVLQQGICFCRYETLLPSRVVMTWSIWNPNQMQQWQCKNFLAWKMKKNRTPTGNSSKFSGVNFLQTVLPCHVYIINTEPLKKTGQMSARNPFCGRSSQSLHVKRPVRSVGRSRHPGSQNMAASPTGGIGWNQVCTTRSAERFWCGLAHRNNLKLR